MHTLSVDENDRRMTKAIMLTTRLKRREPRSDRGSQTDVNWTSAVVGHTRRERRNERTSGESAEGERNFTTSCAEDERKSKDSARVTY